MIRAEETNKRIKGRCVPVPDVTGSQRDSMFLLLSAYFDNVTRETFESDLAEKQWVILIEEGSEGSICGFSTLCMLGELDIDGCRIRALFSGDTIVDSSCRNSSELFRTFLSFTAGLSRQAEEDGCRLFWLLISMGYRTYRLLPRFFKEYYPRYDRATPAFEKRVIDSLAAGRFPEEYDPEKGIIHYPERREFLRPGLSVIPDGRLLDPAVRFFRESNPLHALGDELACIAEITGSNLKGPAFRLMGIPDPSVEGPDDE